MHASYSRQWPINSMHTSYSRQWPSWPVHLNAYSCRQWPIGPMGRLIHAPAQTVKVYQWPMHLYQLMESLHSHTSTLSIHMAAA
eukprot:3455986-Amphidinium_carterae.1